MDKVAAPVDPRERSTARDFILLTVIVGALFGCRLIRSGPSRYSGDLLYHLGFAQHVLAEPSRISEADFQGRRHPLFVAVLASSLALFGATTTPFLVLCYLGHLVAVILLRQFLLDLDVEEQSATLAAALFAVFPGANNLFADPAHFSRIWNLALALAALRSLLGNKPWLFLVWFSLSLANFEDLLLLPMSGLALALLYRRNTLRGNGWVHVAAITLSMSYGAVAGGAHEELLKIASLQEMTIKAATLPVEIAHSAVMLRSDLLPSLGGRLVLVLPVLVAGVVTLRRPERTQMTAIGFLLLLGFLLAAPYLARPTGGVWHSRYLYIPASACFAVAGIWLGPLGASSRRFVVLFLAVIGLLNTERASDVRRDLYLHAFAPGGVEVVLGAISADLLGRSFGRLALDPGDCAFVERELVHRVHMALPCAIEE